jgi:hypothetical protein
MKKSFSLFLIVWLCKSSLAIGQTSSVEQTKPATMSVVDSTTISGKIMCGYQGWFTCEGDQSDLGWTHWASNRRKPMGPGNVSVDVWPDVSELETDERFATQFKNADGQPAEVFSSGNRKTVLRHFRWMKEYGIDGIFLQRFANELTDKKAREHKDRVLSHVREGANQSGRTYALMYDLSGLRAGQVDRVRQDWIRLNSEDAPTNDNRYLRHQGKPLVAIWGIGFADDREYSLRECLDLVQWLKSQGCAVMLGVPSYWREGNRDATDDPMLRQVLQLSDVISPWSVGRYRTPQEAERHANEVWMQDLQWCQQEQIQFLPVVFPGFSWQNLKNEGFDSIPRLKGQFLWSQIAGAKRIGSDMVYVAMFDEVDEGTAIFKCTHQPPVDSRNRFLDLEGLPSDHYLKIVGEGGKLIRGQNATVDFE